MPLNGSGTASKPAGTTAVSGEVIASASFNSVIDDIYSIFNTFRPAFGGGTLDDAADVRAALDLEPGTDVQAYSAVLAALAALYTVASAAGPGSLDFLEDADNGTNKVTLKAPSALAADRVITFPDKAGTIALTSDFLGAQTVFIPAIAMTPNTTNGPSVGTTETSTNKVMLKTLDFDPSTEEFAQFAVQMPKGWNEGTITAKFVWTHGSTTTNFGACWGLEAIAFADGDDGDTAWGTEVDTADTGGTTNKIYHSAESGAVTVGNSPGADEYVKFRVTRVVGNAGDTMAVDAKLLGIRFLYTIDAATDD